VDRNTLMNGMMGVLVLCALGELAWAFFFRQKVHDFRDSLSSLALGIGQQAINVYLSSGFLAVYMAIHANVAPVSLDMRVWWHWLIFVPLCDLAYYVAHRTMHSVNFWLAAHIVHHQAEDYNHISAMRQSWTAWIVNFPFFLPLALFVPLEFFIVGQLGIMFFQFMSHNGVFDRKLGVLDRIFVTPANHRVHHGINGPYLGANCGGMLVLWDRVFGTYVEEDPEIPIQMGSGLDVDIYDPFEANLDYYRRIVFVMNQREGGWNKLKLWFQTPETLFAELDEQAYQARYRPAQPNRGALTSGQKGLLFLGLVGLVVLLALHRGLFASSPFFVNVLTGVSVMMGIWFFARALTRLGSDPAPVAAK
jgi:sterol desaturase/sphingolipid hydroxylase (fatty acid hydroxylase superfamily)